MHYIHVSDQLSKEEILDYCIEQLKGIKTLPPEININVLLAKIVNAQRQIRKFEDI